MLNNLLKFVVSVEQIDWNFSLCIAENHDVFMSGNPDSNRVMHCATEFPPAARWQQSGLFCFA
jgi:hypothetical protein